MPINYIPNDPLAVGDLPMIEKEPRADRPAGRAGFDLSDTVPQPQRAKYLPDTADFAFWQCREAALAAVEAWEGLGETLADWARTGKKLKLSVDFSHPDFTGDRRLNAFYDGQGLRFFILNDLTPPVLTGQSTDTVAHETGHALLDTLRPELFGSFIPEEAAFHEAFGDCVALLTALADQPTRVKLLALTADLSAANFVESGSEYLSDAIRRVFGNVAASRPRRALNTFQWQLPSTLPAGQFTDPPTLLSREAHSFSRVFTGCFYDLIRRMFTAQAAQNEATLAAVAVSAGTLLLAGVRAAQRVPRFFRAVGRGMMLADDDANDGANRDALDKAFADHDIVLGGGGALVPTAALAGAAPTVAKRSASLKPATAKDIRGRIGAEAGTRLSVTPKEVYGVKMAEAVHTREIDLGPVDRRLAGCVARTPETVLVGDSGGQAAVLGGLPDPTQTEDEVRAFVETLLRCGRIKLEGTGSAREPITHVVHARGGKKLLERVRFLCG